METIVEIMQPIMIAALTSVLGLLLSQTKNIFRWLTSWGNRQKLLEKTAIDDIVWQALETGVSNIAGTVREQMQEAIDRNGGKLSPDQKLRLRNTALDEAKGLLRNLGVDLAEYSQSALNAMVRRIVDNLAKDSAGEAPITITGAGE